MKNIFGAIEFTWQRPFGRSVKRRLIQVIARKDNKFDIDDKYLRR